MTTKHIGIVGMSAEGAALCYRTICVEGQELLGGYEHPEVTMHTFPFERYMEPMRENRWEEAGRMMLESAAKVAQAGADFAICPDNTAHQALDLVRHESPLPWLHIAEEVARSSVERGHRRLGVLGTKWLMEGPVYPRRLESQGLEWMIPESDERRRVDEVIFDELVRGRFEEAARRDLQEIIATLGERGCDAVVLGCTELPLLIREGESPLPAIDSTRTLARAALAEATRGE